jgi:MOSC domain-containing protein YiiM
MILPKRLETDPAPAAPEIMRVDRLGIQLRHLYISRGHNYFGHHGKPAGDHAIEEAACLYCITGRGIIGDRFFDHADSYKGQITFFSQDVFKRMCRAMRANAQPSAMRRNVIVEGVDLNQLIGRRFSIRGIQFEGTEECRPCHWMDAAVAPGAEEFLKGNGGLRARILNDGWLRSGAADLFVYEEGSEHGRTGPL